MGVNMKIYLIRHGQTQWNIERRLQGTCDSPLTKKGIKDAKLLGDRLREIDIDIIYSSLSPRAMNTSKIIKGKRNIEIVAEQALKEMNVGSWQGRTWDDIKRSSPQEYHNYWNAPHLYAGINGGENFYQTQNRAVALIDNIIHERKYKNILLVSHGVTVQSIIAHYQNKAIDKLWELPLVQGTSLSLIEVDDGKIKIPYLGDISHLQDA